jgi:hypothetical protein
MTSPNTSRVSVERIVHCDWSTSPKKRWMSRAGWDGQAYIITAPEHVGDLATFFSRLRNGLNAKERLFVGFDFPIGLPKAYADKVGVTDFLEVLPKFGTGVWSRFYDKCMTDEEISLYRPFYPYTPDGASQERLTNGLGLTMDQLLRECERATEDRGSASQLFWTLGGKQVGPAAISGWRDLLAPAIGSGTNSPGFWPFQGDLPELFKNHSTVVAETYPAEGYRHLHFPNVWGSKRRKPDRKARRNEFRAWSTERHVVFDNATLQQIDDGFGPSKDGDDPFDALVGLCSMVDVVLGHRVAGGPNPNRFKVEGWILGQATNLN